MSHRDRDSDSKRRHSKFDREPSPKKYRRDGKQDREKERDRVTTNGVGGGNQNHHHDPPKHSSQPSRSRTHHQRDERGSDVKVGRRTDQREDGEIVVAQSKEKTERVETRQSREQRDEKSRAKLDDNFQRKDGFPERKDDPPSTMRKRPAFREKKIPVDSGNASAAATVTVKPGGHTDHPSERNERKEERSNNPSHLDRPERQNGEDKAPNKREPRRDGFSSRVRYGGSGGNSNYRGRDKFSGGQGYQPYQPIKTRADKWKHDLYQEVNKDPIPKNEDDQIAKLEALLAS